MLVKQTKYAKQQKPKIEIYFLNIINEKLQGQYRNPRGLGDLWENGYLFSRIWGELEIILGAQAHRFWDLGSLA